MDSYLNALNLDKVRHVNLVKEEALFVIVFARLQFILVIKLITHEVGHYGKTMKILKGSQFYMFCQCRCILETILLKNKHAN